MSIKSAFLLLLSDKKNLERGWSEPSPRDQCWVGAICSDLSKSYVFQFKIPNVTSTLVERVQEIIFVKSYG